MNNKLYSIFDAQVSIYHPGTLERHFLRITRHDPSLCLIGDSHAKSLAIFSRSNGCCTYSLPGGGVNHGHQLAAKNNYFLGNTTQLIIALGGNDMGKPLFDSFRYVSDLKNMIDAFLHYNPECQVVSVSPIPRDTPEVRSSVFINRVELIDASLFNFHKRHHHIISDAFVMDPPIKGGDAYIRRELYQADLVHLAKSGVRILEKMMSFVLLSMSNEDYSNSCEFGEGLDRRIAFFKF